MWRAVLTVSAFAIAMAHVETMIVVYLRRLYYPDGFRFPLVIIDTPTLLLELEREAATLVMLAAYGLAAGRTRAGKLADFLIASASGISSTMCGSRQCSTGRPRCSPGTCFSSSRCHGSGR
jgi:hypothetical protein